MMTIIAVQFFVGVGIVLLINGVFIIEMLVYMNSSSKRFGEDYRVCGSILVVNNLGVIIQT